MAGLVCDICGGRLISDADGEIFTCESCRTHYPKERVRKMLVEFSTPVQVEGIANIQSLLAYANSFVDIDADKAEKQFHKILEMDPKCGEAWEGLFHVSQSEGLWWQYNSGRIFEDVDGIKCIEVSNGIGAYGDRCFVCLDYSNSAEGQPYFSCTKMEYRYGNYQASYYFINKKPGIVAQVANDYYSNMCFKYIQNAIKYSQHPQKLLSLKDRLFFTPETFTDDEITEIVSSKYLLEENYYPWNGNTAYSLVTKESAELQKKEIDSEQQRLTEQQRLAE